MLKKNILFLIVLCLITIKAFTQVEYFDNKYALTNNSKFYYFLDKSGNQVIKLGEWQKAEQFSESTGFAKVWDEQEQIYLLDTLGNTYPLAESIEDLKTKPNLTALSLLYGYYGKLITDILNHKQLEVLIITDSSYPQILLEIGQLQNLKHLILQNCQIQILPSEIGKLQQLQSLNLSRNQLSKVPEEVSTLQNLYSLDISNNYFSQIPSEVQSLKNLQYLNLSSNQIQQLPFEIESFQTLQKLDISYNQFSQLSIEIGQLQNLQSLNLVGNEFSNLPIEIGNLLKLYELLLNENQLETLPPETGNLLSLQSLNLSNNQINSLPKSIENLQKLQTLDLAYNQLSELPQEIGQIQGLKTLELANNQMITLPESIGNLQDLQSLILDMNQIRSLPETLEQLQNLQKLHLNENPIKENEEVSIATYNRLKKAIPDCEILGLVSEKYENYYTQKETVENNPDSYESWFRLSWQALLVEKYEESITAVQKTLELNSEVQIVEKNLALAYLLTDQWEEAKQIYKKWKGEYFPDNSRLCDDIFLEDIKLLEGEGISHPDFEKVREFFYKKPSKRKSNKYGKKLKQISYNTLVQTKWKVDLDHLEQEINRIIERMPEGEPKSQAQVQIVSMTPILKGMFEQVTFKFQEDGTLKLEGIPSSPPDDLNWNLVGKTLSLSPGNDDQIYFEAFGSSTLLALTLTQAELERRIQKNNNTPNARDQQMLESIDEITIILKAVE